MNEEILKTAQRVLEVEADAVRARADALDSALESLARHGWRRIVSLVWRRLEHSRNIAAGYLAVEPPPGTSLATRS